MSEFEVAIKIAGKLDKSLQTSVSSAQKMLGSLGKGGLSSALTGIGNVMESTGKALTTGVTMPVIALGATSVKEFGSVDKSMKLVQATMGSTDAQAKQLESTMKKAAANSVFGMQDAADATLNFARQGFNAKQAGDMLTPALNLAAGTATDLSVVTGGLGNALKMFGKTAAGDRCGRHPGRTLYLAMVLQLFLSGHRPQGRRENRNCTQREIRG